MQYYLLDFETSLRKNQINGQFLIIFLTQLRTKLLKSLLLIIIRSSNINNKILNIMSVLSLLQPTKVLYIKIIKR